MFKKKNVLVNNNNPAVSQIYDINYDIIIKYASTGKF